MYAPAELKANTVKAINAFTALQTNAAKIASILTTTAPVINGEQQIVNEWRNSFVAAQADFQTLLNQTGAFTSSMQSILNATYETARVQPLWDNVNLIANSIFTYSAKLAAFSTDINNLITQYDAAIASSGVTNDPVQLLLHAFPAQIFNLANALAFLQDYKTALAEDVSACLLWAGSDLGAKGLGIPPALKEFQFTGHSDYTINTGILQQFTTLQLS
ncbi:hypothetical protein EIP91_004304 [Steccherinum ochraceum]|uniref:Uncharacterized protein n=1 Tax=Steccherinum ochraceum TaxID=92696 RepID=A0A4R0RF77_9APHY|nr:hypothetical protein EIP91_004304 [Steccherinum ochraceum]